MSQRDPRDPWPLELVAESNIEIGGSHTVEVTIPDVAHWIQCDSGLTREQFIARLNEELDTLGAIDPYCEK